MRKVAFLLAVLLLAAAVPAVAQPDPSLAEVDRLRTAGRFEEALAALERQQREHPARADVLWRLSRTRVDLGERAPAARQQAIYRAAMADAEAAVQADARNLQAYLALAIAAGRVALIAGNREKVELSRVVKDNVDRALTLDPRNDVALHVRGRWHYEVASQGVLVRAAARVVYGGLPRASYAEAARDFEQAIAVNDLIRHRVELAKAYVKLHRKAEARTQLERALAMPATDADDPGYHQEARALLSEID
jgi:tetratricopeptide (TPR) repeat protein